MYDRSFFRNCDLGKSRSPRSYWLESMIAGPGLVAAPSPGSYRPGVAVALVAGPLLALRRCRRAPTGTVGGPDMWQLRRRARTGGGSVSRLLPTGRCRRPRRRVPGPAALIPAACMSERHQRPRAKSLTSCISVRHRRPWAKSPPSSVHVSTAPTPLGKSPLKYHTAHGSISVATTG